MSKIRRISIKGIRNFSDNHDNEIVFKCPITLILGENGTGKTTIIECLKFATTGDYPPNSDKGKSFVTDPALKSTNMTRAAVRLEFDNKKGQIMTTYRGLELRRGPSSLTICSIDNTLSYFDKETKKSVNTSNRCADTNAMIIDMMGVSKAILNYVIFCHQDDSFWPLDGGKELKAKIDEIFGTSNFNKALETTRNLHKNYTAKIKVLKNDKLNLKAIVDEVEAKKDKLKRDKERRDELIQDIEKIDSKIQPIDSKLDNIKESISVYNQKVENTNKKRVEWEMAQKEVSYLQSNIKLFNGTNEELFEKINLFDKEFEEKSIQIGQEQKKLENGYAKEKDIMKLINEKKVSIGTLQQKMKDQQARIIKRNEILQTALKQLNLSDLSSDADENDIAIIMNKINEKLSKFENEAEENRIKRQQEELSMQSEVESLISKTSASKSELNNKEKESDDIQDNIKVIRKEIAITGTSVNRLKDSESKLEAANAEYDRVLNDLDVNSTKTEIEDLIKIETENEQKIRVLDKEIAALNRQQGIQSEIDIHQSNHKVKTEQIEAIREKQGSKLQKILDVDEIPTKKLRQSIEDVQKKLNITQRNIKRDIESAHQQVVTLETTLKHQKKDLDRHIKEIQADKKKLSAYCTYDNYDETLNNQSDKLKSLRDQKGFYTYQNIAYEKYLKEIDNKKPCCPLCTRDFKNNDEVQKFKKDMTLQKERHPNTVNSFESKLKEEEIKYNNMLQLKPTVMKIVQFENHDYEQFMKQIKEMEKQLENAKTKWDHLKESLLGPEEKLKLCDAVIMDVALWDQCMDEIEKLSRKIKALQQSLNYQSNSTKSLQTAQTEREDCHEKISSCRKTKQLLQTKLDKYNNDKQHAWENKKSLQERVFNIRNDMQKVNQLREKEKELMSKLSSFNESILILRDKYLAENEELSAANKKLDLFKKETQNNLKMNKNIIDRDKQISFKLSSYQKEIDDFVHQGIENQLKQCEDSIKKNDNDLNLTKIENAKLAKILQQLNHDLSGQQQIKKDLLGNVDLRKKKEKVNNLEQQLNLMKSTVDNMNYNEIVAEMNQLKVKKDSYIEKRHKSIGVKDEMDRGIALLESELRNENYVQNMKKYQSTCSTITITQSLIDDLQVYMQGMDQAMTDYHKDRMNAVNEIMNRMWCAVYKGTDTKGIQIKTESTGKLDTARRVFNYKLVQTKHDVEMEMKGRCSAGQRVLVSIIIRMALAEAFCGDCGVLALDEPTTNLDVHNARSLAQALVKIVECRSKYQKNFQLIIITHDEEFLEVLTKLDPDHSYYKLERDDRSGRTVITQQNKSKPNK